MPVLHHVALIVSDYARSKHFYVDVLGFSIVAEHYRAERQGWKLDLAGQGLRLELFSFPAPPPRPSRPEACGLRHLALSVTNLDTEIARLQASGIEVEPVRVDEYTGARFTFFADPDGLPLELYESTQSARNLANPPRPPQHHRAAGV